MIGFLKLIMDGMADDPAEQSEFIEEAHRSAVHLLNIINDILDVARIEAGKMPLDLDPVKLDDLLTDVEKFTRPQAQQKHLSFEILTPNTRDEVILYGNYQRLLQVMLNLVGNAIKFTHEGGITISAEILPKKVVVHNQERPGFVKISVADTGIGVSLEKQDKLFQTFSQVDGSRTRQYGGTGLGLTISQKLVEAMGGVVNFYSMGEGLGSTVTFTVPLYQEPVMIASSLTNSVDFMKED
jgi:signal transduction histidine kinase